MSISRTKMLQVSKCLIGLAVMMLQSCDVADNRRDLLCGNWESVEGKPDVLIYKVALYIFLIQRISHYKYVWHLIMTVYLIKHEVS